MTEKKPAKAPAKKAPVRKTPPKKAATKEAAKPVRKRAPKKVDPDIAIQKAAEAKSIAMMQSHEAAINVDN